MKRIKLSDRKLPTYTKGEEIMNMVTHIVGGSVGIIALVLCSIKSTLQGNSLALIGSIIYGIAMIAMYCISSVYHGLRKSTAKKVLQIIDHCAIYFLIAGTYTPILLAKFVTVYPMIGWSILIIQWGLCFLASTLTAIDLHQYRVLSMICYILMGWGIIFVWKYAVTALTRHGMLLLLWGGIAYTIGAILYGIGVKKRWMHSVFHIFVVIGSILQFLSMILYII